MTTFWTIIKNSYRSGWAFMLACPLLFFFPVATELLQHGIEAHVGMFDSIAAAQTVELHPLRLAGGVLKTLALMLMGYWVPRYIAAGHDRAAPTRRDPVAMRLFAVFLVVQMALGAAQTALSGSAAALGAAMLANMVIGGLLMPWGVAAALGNRAIGPARSLRIAGFDGAWIGIFAFVLLLPLMVPHYILALAPVLHRLGTAATWALLSADALLVGYIGCVAGASVFYLANWMARRRLVTLAGATD